MYIVIEEFKDRLKKLRNKKGLTSEELANTLDIPHSSIRRMESQNDIPRRDRLVAIANFFNVTVDYLLTGVEISETNLENYGLLPYIPTTMERLPVLGTVRAGEPILMSDSIEGYMEIETDVLRGRKGFILRVKGDSMSGDGIFDGDLAIIELKNEAEPHEIAVVSIDNEEATLKRVECLHGVCALKPSNPAYEIRMHPAEMIHIYGVVVETRRRFK